jgi:hypothetical protein
LSQGKVLSFEEALQQQKQEQHEESCPHCKFINGTTASFIENVYGLNVHSDAFAEEVKGLIDYVETVTRANTLHDIGTGLLEAAHDTIYGDDEDDEYGYPSYDDDGGGFEGGYED